MPQIYKEYHETILVLNIIPSKDKYPEISEIRVMIEKEVVKNFYNFILDTSRCKELDTDFLESIFKLVMHFKKRGIRIGVVLSSDQLPQDINYTRQYPDVEVYHSKYEAVYHLHT